LVYPAFAYKRKLFNGYAKVIIQSIGQPGTIVFKAMSPGLNEHGIEITAVNSDNKTSNKIRNDIMKYTITCLLPFFFPAR
jgi:hypothetical protein